MKWIKASERLPEILKDVFIKEGSMYHTGYYNDVNKAFKSHVWNDFIDSDFSNIEWLDESINQESNPNISHKLEKVAAKAVGEQDKDIQISLLESKIEELEEDLRNARNNNEAWLKNENINQEGSLKDSYRTVTILMNIDSETIDSVYSDKHQAIEVCRANRTLAPLTFNVIAPLLQNEYKGDDLVAEASNSDLAAEATLRSTVETQIEQRNIITEMLAVYNKFVHAINNSNMKGTILHVELKTVVKKAEQYAKRK